MTGNGKHRANPYIALHVSSPCFLPLSTSYINEIYLFVIVRIEPILMHYNDLNSRVSTKAHWCCNCPCFLTTRQWQTCTMMQSSFITLEHTYSPSICSPHLPTVLPALSLPEPHSWNESLRALDWLLSLSYMNVRFLCIYWFTYITHSHRRCPWSSQTKGTAVIPYRDILQICSLMLNSIWQTFFNFIVSSSNKSLTYWRTQGPQTGWIKCFILRWLALFWSQLCQSMFNT